MLNFLHRRSSGHASLQMDPPTMPENTTPDSTDETLDNDSPNNETIDHEGAAGKVTTDLGDDPFVHFDEDDDYTLADSCGALGCRSTTNISAVTREGDGETRALCPSCVKDFLGGELVR